MRLPFSRYVRDNFYTSSVQVTALMWTMAGCNILMAIYSTIEGIVSNKYWYFALAAFNLGAAVFSAAVSSLPYRTITKLTKIVDRDMAERFKKYEQEGTLSDSQTKN